MSPEGPTTVVAEEPQMEVEQEPPAPESAQNSTLPSTVGTSTLGSAAVDPAEILLIAPVSESDGTPRMATPSSGTPRGYMLGYQSLGEAPASSEASELSLGDRPPVGGAQVYDMTAPVLRPDRQSDTPASGAAAHSEETQMDGRFAPYPVSGPPDPAEAVGQEPEPETDAEMDVDEPAGS